VVISRQDLRLPRGRDLPDVAWAQRHTVVLGVLFAHLPFLLGAVVLASLGRTGAHHAEAASGTAEFLEMLVPAVAAAGLAGLASLDVPRRVRMLASTFGLLFCSAAVVHIGGGDVVWHFHFFVVVALVTLYQSWGPYASAIAFVLLHHVLMSLLAPENVFSGTALDSALTATLVHGVFILAASAAGLLTWSWNEQLEDSVTRAAQEFGSAFDHAPIGMALVSPTGRLQRVNAALCVMLGRPEGDLLKLSFAQVTHPEDLDRHLELVVSMLFGSVEGGSVRKRFVRSDGHVIWAQLSIRLVRDGRGAPEHFITHVEDVTARKEAEDQILFQASHDPLTGLLHREPLFTRLRSAPAQTAVVFVDVDGFKAVNDSYGHAVGDVVLVEVASRLRALVREQDLVARVGGDEFVVVAEAAGAEAYRLAERVRRAFHPPFRLDDTRSLQVSASVGVALAERAGDATALVGNADTAMYQAKNAGKDRVEFAGPLLGG
jgi:diguanylate cyclase (GGDEF)-like protein/PAS domain S-box-containing protein